MEKPPKNGLDLRPKRVLLSNPCTVHKIARVIGDCLAVFHLRRECRGRIHRIRDF